MTSSNLIYFIFLSVIIMSESDAHIQDPHDEEGLEEEDPNQSKSHDTIPSRKASNECFLSFFWVGGEVEDNFASFPCAPQNFPGWVSYRGLFEVGLVAVFAEEGLKKGVGLINWGFWVGLQLGGEE